MHEDAEISSKELWQTVPICIDCGKKVCRCRPFTEFLYSQKESVVDTYSYMTQRHIGARLREGNRALQ